MFATVWYNNASFSDSPLLTQEALEMKCGQVFQWSGTKRRARAYLPPVLTSVSSGLFFLPNTILHTVCVKQNLWHKRFYVIWR